MRQGMKLIGWQLEEKKCKGVMGYYGPCWTEINTREVIESEARNHTVRNTGRIRPIYAGKIENVSLEGEQE